VTTAEQVRQRREDFVAGAMWRQQDHPNGLVGCDSCTKAHVEAFTEARKRYPPPRLPRVVTVDGRSYRYFEEQIQVLQGVSDWVCWTYSGRELIRALNQLLEHPFEEAE